MSNSPSKFSVCDSEAILVRQYKFGPGAPQSMHAQLYSAADLSSSHAVGLLPLLSSRTHSLCRFCNLDCILSWSATWQKPCQSLTCLGVPMQTTEAVAPTKHLSLHLAVFRFGSTNVSISL